MSALEPEDKPHCLLLFGTAEHQQCHSKMTFHHFRTFCNTGMHTACPIYGTVMNEMKEPIEWLQFVASKEGPLKEELPNESGP